MKTKLKNVFIFLSIVCIFTVLAINTSMLGNNVDIQTTESTTGKNEDNYIQEGTTSPEEITETTTKPTEPEETEPKPTEPEIIEPISLGEFRLTAYCSCAECCGKWAYNRPTDENGNEIVYGSTGEVLTAGISIAVDPNVIPYMSNVIINGHTYVAHDTGGSIVGNRIDIYFDNHQDTVNFGVQYAEIFLPAK